ncbi:MAG: DUF2127 domain-containing protein [Pseudomonadota bacterium]
MTNAHPPKVADTTLLTVQRRTLRAIAIYEAIKGTAALAVVIGVIDLMHHDVRRIAITLIGHFGLDPGAHYPSVLLHYADLLPGANVRLLVVIAIGYVALRMVEAYGLWNERVWGEWVAVLSGAFYIPVEMEHLVQRPSVISGVVLAANAFLVSYLAYQLWQRHKMNTLGACE